MWCLFRIGYILAGTLRRLILFLLPDLCCAIEQPPHSQVAEVVFQELPLIGNSVWSVEDSRRLSLSLYAEAEKETAQVNESPQAMIKRRASLAYRDSHTSPQDEATPNEEAPSKPRIVCKGISEVSGDFWYLAFLLW